MSNKRFDLEIEILTTHQVPVWAESFDDAVAICEACVEALEADDE